MSESSTAANKKVLIVEDHPVFRAMLAQLIGQEPGMEVCGEVDNITDAMSLIELSLPDMAVVDITLRGTSGLEWIKTLKTQRIHLPVLVLSMHAEALYAERVLRAGAKGYISKLEPPAEVMAAIRKVMDGGIHVSRLVSETIVGRLGHADQAQRPSGLDLLSDREIEVFQLIGRGMNSPEIAAHTRLGTSTVDSYRARIKLKLGVRNAAALYQYAARWRAECGLLFASAHRLSRRGVFRHSTSLLRAASATKEDRSRNPPATSATEFSPLSLGKHASPPCNTLPAPPWSSRHLAGFRRRCLRVVVQRHRTHANP